jgi:hypothetical protein
MGRGEGALDSSKRGVLARRYRWEGRSTLRADKRRVLPLGVLLSWAGMEGTILRAAGAGVRACDGCGRGDHCSCRAFSKRSGKGQARRRSILVVAIIVTASLHTASGVHTGRERHAHKIGGDGREKRDGRRRRRRRKATYKRRAWAIVAGCGRGRVEEERRGGRRGEKVVAAFGTPHVCGQRRGGVQHAPPARVLTPNAEHRPHHPGCAQLGCGGSTK